MKSGFLGVFVKAIIGGKTFDTKSAVLIVEVVDTFDPHRDPGAEGPWSFQAGLYYRVRARDFFLAGQGGKYTVFGGRSRCIPLDRDAAYDFALCHLADENKLRRYFPWYYL